MAARTLLLAGLLLVALVALPLGAEARGPRGYICVGGDCTNILPPDPCGLLAGLPVNCDAIPDEPCLVLPLVVVEVGFCIF